MTLLQTIRTLFEVAMTAFVIWCIFNEDKLVAFEEKYFGWHKNKGAKIIKFSSNEEEL